MFSWNITTRCLIGVAVKFSVAVYAFDATDIIIGEVTNSIISDIITIGIVYDNVNVILLDRKGSLLHTYIFLSTIDYSSESQPIN